MDNIIHIIINHNLILINRVINHKLLNTNNVNGIVRIEEHNNIVPKIIIIGINWENMAMFIVEYLHMTKKNIIPLLNNYYAIKKNPTDPSLTFLITETSMMNKNFTAIFLIKTEGIISFVYWR